MSQILDQVSNVAASSAAQSAPEIPEEILRRRFDERVRDALVISTVIVLPALGARMVNVGDELGQPERSWTYLVLIAEFLAMLLVGAGYYYRRLPLSCVQWIGSLLAISLILGACLAVVFHQLDWPNIGSGIALIGTGSVLLSWRWFSVTAVVGMAGMLSSAASIHTLGEWYNSLFWMMVFLGIAVSCHWGRLSLFRRIESLRWKDDWARGQLHALIEQLQYEVEERRAAEAELRRKEEERRQLTHRLLTVQEMERGRISRELHDELGQILSAISLQVRDARRLASPVLAPRLDESADALRNAIDEVRRISTELRPSLLDDLGLESALRWSVERQSARSEPRVEFESRNGHGRFPLDVEAACFRIAQEALTNSLRHSRASLVRVRYDNSGRSLTVRVMDDGVGFDANEVRSRPIDRRGLGLLGMRERAESLGGRIVVQTSRGQGTIVEVAFERSQLTKVGIP